MGFLVVGPLTGLGMVHERRNLGESLNSRHNRRKRRGYLRILHVGEVLSAADVEIMQFGVERLAYLACSGRKVDHAGIVQNAANLEAVRFEPCRDLCNVFRRSSESGAKLLRSQPLVIFRRTRLLLALNKIVQIGLLRGGALQQKKKVQFLPVFHQAEIRR